MTNSTLESVVRELLKGADLHPFSLDWILRHDTTEESVKAVYAFLKEIGSTNDQIALHAELLGRDPQTIQGNYQALLQLGLTQQKIATLAHLLGMSPQTIQENYQALLQLGLTQQKILSRAELLGLSSLTILANYQALLQLGLTKEKIASHANLLGRDPQTIQENYQALLQLGLTKEKIGTNAALLGMNPKTIQTNYEHHVGLLRQNYNDRNSGRRLLTNQAQLLGISPVTIEANVQLLHDMGLDYNNSFLLGTTPQLKRTKMGWMLRELFNYQNLPQEEKRAAIYAMRDYIRDHPRVLIKSIPTMEKEKDSLMAKVARYAGR